MGGLIKADRGHILILPRIRRKDDFADEQEWLMRYGALLTTILSVHKHLSPRLEETLPQWASEVRTEAELANREELDRLAGAALRAQQAVEKAQAELQSFDRRKLLLTATGKTLERVVGETLKRFGFDVVVRDDDRTDLILKYEGRVGVCEVKGLTGSGREKDATQLEKWVSIYHSENDIEPKGILLANTFREQPILDRKETSFPAQMLPYLKRKELVALTTAQLFVADVIYDSDPGRVREFCRQMFDTIGVLEADFSDPTEVLRKVSTKSKT